MTRPTPRARRELRGTSSSAARRLLLASLVALALALPGATAAASPGGAAAASRHVAAATSVTHTDPVPRRIVAGWIRPGAHMVSALQEIRASADLWSEASPTWFRVTSATTITGRNDPAVVTTLRSLGVPVVPSVTESLHAPAMEALLAHDASRAALRNGIVGLVDAYGYDGIDLNFEDMVYGGTAEQKARVARLFVRFVTELGAALDARGKLLSVTVGPRTSTTDPRWSIHDYAGLGAVADRFRVMTYNFTFRASPPGPIAPLSWVETVLKYTVSVVPRTKVQVGVPLYGYDWIKDNDPATVAASVSTYDDAEALRVSVGATRVWSSTHKAPYFRYTDAAGRPHEVWYNDASSTRAKMRLVGAYGIRGLVFWHVSGVDERQWPILRTYATPRPSTLTVSAPARITYGSTVTVSGTLTTASGAPRSGVAVTLQRRTHGSWKPAASATTSASGTVAFTYKPSVNGQFRLKSAPSWTYAAAASEAVTTAVRWRVRAALDDATIAQGTQAVLRGTVGPVRSGTRIERQRLVAGTWVTVAATTPSTTGAYAFRFTPEQAGSYTYRVLVPGTDRNATGSSPTLTLTVS